MVGNPSVCAVCKPSERASASKLGGTTLSLLNGNPALIEIDVERTEGKREKVFTLTKAGRAKARALLDQDRAAI